MKYPLSENFTFIKFAKARWIGTFGHQTLLEVRFLAFHHKHCVEVTEGPNQFIDVFVSLVSCVVGKAMRTHLRRCSDVAEQRYIRDR